MPHDEDGFSGIDRARYESHLTERIETLERELAEEREISTTLAADVTVMGQRIQELEGALSEGSSKWIPVGERLPDNDAMVLAHAPCISREPINTARCIDGRWITTFTHPVTHWMPLPGAPK